MRRDGDPGQAEHQIGDDDAHAGADDLSDHVDEELHATESAEQRVRQADDGIEMCTRDGADGQDDGHQGSTGRDGILEQLQASVSRAEGLRGDARPDDRNQQKRCAHELGDRLAHDLSTGV